MPNPTIDDLPVTLSSYRLTRLLGSGGMGSVYMATDIRSNATVAIKLMHPQFATDEAFRERFEREADVAATLTSLYTVRVLDYDFAEGSFLIVMEYVEGPTLRDVLKEQEKHILPIARALRVAIQVGRALEAARRLGVVHRDIKPENVLIRAGGRVKVMDFGIARQVSHGTYTVPGGFVGTLLYAAPEQVLGKADHRTDIYALGALLYEMLAGRPPFLNGVLELLHTDTIGPPLEPLAGLPTEIVDIALHSLEREPVNRYQSASELVFALERAARRIDPSPPGPSTAAADYMTRIQNERRAPEPEAPGSERSEAETEAWIRASDHNATAHSMGDGVPLDLAEPGTSSNYPGDTGVDDLRKRRRPLGGGRLKWGLAVAIAVSSVGIAAGIALLFLMDTDSGTGNREADGDNGEASTSDSPAETATEPLAEGDAGGGGLELRIPAGESIVIGASVPLTGPDSGFGIDSRDGAIVGIEQWKADNGEDLLGHDIELVAEDDGCLDAAIATAAAERLVDTPNVVAVVGPLCSGGAQAAIPLYAERGLVMISGSANRTDLAETQPAPRFFFRTVFRNADEGVVQARYAIDTVGAVSAYVVDDTESYGEDLANAAEETLTAEDVDVTREKIERGTTDFSALASRAASDAPEVFIFEGFNPECQLILSALRSAGYEGRFMSGDGCASVVEFIQPHPQVAEGAYFAGCGGDYPEELLGLYDEFIGNEPSTPFVAHYADAARIILDAVAAVAEDGGGELVIDLNALRDAIAATEFSGFTGTVAFNEFGDRSGTAGEELGLPECLVEGGAFVTLR